MNVYNMQKKSTLPYFKLSQSPADGTAVTAVQQGHWALSFLESGEGEQHELLPVVVDPKLVFGEDSTLINAAGFEAFSSLEELLAQPQVMTSKTPCAFAPATATLAPGESITLASLYGKAESTSQLEKLIAPTVSAKGYVTSKRQAAT